ncbi:MAG: T9SS type A sorting domain-containing protein [Bacteroidetes bacterium]|nr:MAG: T9SS type A sorting domain-containing protein [Bacteroidota bacterium]
MKATTLFCLLAGVLPSLIRPATVQAQCVFDPVVTGNLLVCPETSTILSTQSYDAYQWYRRSYPNGTAEPISGATDSVLSVHHLETPVYISVLATKDGCSEQSPEVLVDGLVFLPVTVQSLGTFDIGNNGEHIICLGDTVFFVLSLPYTLNIQWYNGPDPIPNANNDTLVVTAPGNFSVTASPGDCPNYMTSLGLQIQVVWGNTPGCTTGTGAPLDPALAAVMPNPVRSSLLVAIDAAGPVDLTLFNAVGQAVRHQKFAVSTELHTYDLPNGVYTLHLQTGQGYLLRQVVVQH